MIKIPAGEFTMGTSDWWGRGSGDAGPEHKVYLDGYYIYKNDVTVGMYQKFCAATRRAMPVAPYWGWGNTNYPMVNVTSNDAIAYARWAGVSLPTEAQWEKAARGTDGRDFPWGNDWNPSKCANSVGSTLSSPVPVGSIPGDVSPYGVMDMGGNVGQWCSDWYDADYYKNSPERNPTGPASSPDGGRVLRGGSWGANDVDYFSCANRNDGDPDGDSYGLGFRCAVRQE